MKYLLLSFLTLFFVSCKKDGVRCYECDKNKNGNYTDAGCFTKSEWNAVIFTDVTGSGNLDKSRYCRKK